MINNNMIFFNIIEPFAKPTGSSAKDKAAADKAAKDKEIADKAAKDKAVADKAAKDKAAADKAAKDKAIADKAAKDKAIADKAAKDRTVTTSSSYVSSGLLSSGVQSVAIASGVLAVDSIVDDLIDKEDRIYGSRRSGETIEQSQQPIQPQTGTKADTPVTPPVTPPQDKNICDRVEDKGLEFRKPYLFMLKPPNDIMNINEYNYRLISNIFLNNDNLNKDNKRYLYIFGLFPCKYIPSAYIPLNRKKLLENTKRLDVKPDTIKSIFQNEVQFNKQFQNKIKQFMNKNTIYNNLNLSVFGIILIIYWSLVLLFLNYLMLYYFRSSFNNILAGILLILLLFSIIWKMIYTVQN